MKAILVIDMPYSCCGCQVFCEHRDITLNEGIDEDNERPNKCPLKPMPKSVAEISYDFAYGWSKTLDQFIESQTKIEWMAKGWNACLDEILGEE